MVATYRVPWRLNAKAIEEQTDIEAEEIEECEVEFLATSWDTVRKRRKKEDMNPISQTNALIVQ